MTVLPNTRISTVADEVTKVFADISSHDDNARDARGLATEASQTSSNAREDALVALSAVAHTAKWEQGEIDEGVAKALERRNSQDNSMSTFASEIKLACHRKVRGILPALRQSLVEVWDAESAAIKADKTAPKPLRKAFSRRYHMLRQCMSHVRDEQVWSFNSPSDFHSFAVERDPDLDHVRTAKRLKAIRQSIMDFYADFPVDGLRDAADFLADIGKAELEAARKAKLGGTEMVREQVAVVGEPEVIEPAAGVSDLLDEALADMNA